MDTSELLPLYVVISLVLFLFFVVFLYIQLSIKAKKDSIGGCCIKQVKDETNSKTDTP